MPPKRKRNENASDEETLIFIFKLVFENVRNNPSFKSIFEKENLKRFRYISKSFKNQVIDSYFSFTINVKDFHNYIFTYKNLNQFPSKLVISNTTSALSLSYEDLKKQSLTNQFGNKFTIRNVKEIDIRLSNIQQVSLLLFRYEFPNLQTLDLSYLEHGSRISHFDFIDKKYKIILNSQYNKDLMKSQENYCNNVIFFINEGNYKKKTIFFLIYIRICCLFSSFH